MKTEDRVRKVIHEQLEPFCKPEDIKNKHHIMDDMGADSLDQVELLMAFEEEFGVEISDEDGEKIQTVGDCIAMAERLLPAKCTSGYTDKPKNAKLDEANTEKLMVDCNYVSKPEPESIVDHGVWIDLRKQRPVRGETCLLFDKACDSIDLTTIKYNPDFIDGDYTHWMKIPEKPIEQRMSNPTAAQKRMFAKIAELGCMACLQDGIFTPCSVHHAKDYRYRDHSKVFGLCPAHHQIEYAIPGVPNRHKNPIEFTEQYGTDAELVAECKKLIGEITDEDL